MTSFVCFGCLALVVSSVPALTVQGETDCPTAAEVSAALVGLVAPPNAQAAPDVVELNGHGPLVSVALVSADEVIAVKRLPADLACVARAQAAAVIVAAWEARMRSGVQPPLPVPASVSPRSPSSTAVASTTAAPAELTARDPERDAHALASHSQSQAPSPIDVETGAAILASVAASEWAPAVLLEARFGRRDSRFAVGVDGLAVGTHNATVGSGQGTWRRLGGGVDVRSVTRWQALSLQMQAGLLLTSLTITGQSLPVTSSAALFDPGAWAGLRFGFQAGRLSPWVQATAAYWPRAHSLYVTGTTSSATLSPFEALLGVGFSLGPDR